MQNTTKTLNTSTNCSNLAIDLPANLPTLVRKEQLNNIITNKDGSPDLLAINIYWDSLRSWYNPLKQYQADGNVLSIKKLKTQGVYASAEQLAKKHGVSKRATTGKLAKLELLGLSQRSFRHKQTATNKSYNQRCIYILKNTPYFYNPHGIDREEIKELTPQTNAKYIEEKHNIVFASGSLENKRLNPVGDIELQFNTKELRKAFSKEKDRSNESNFLENSNSFLSSDTSNLAEVKKSVESENHPKETTITSLKVVKFRQNQRRKPTNAEQKAKRGKILHFRQYDNAQDLAYHYPLSAEDADKLQSKSGRPFTLRLQNELLLDMSRKPELQNHRFASKARFLAYMAKVLTYEKRDAVKTSNDNFYIKANQVSDQRVEGRAKAKQDKFLNEIENQAIICVSSENQLKSKLANAFEPIKSYEMLSNLKQFKLTGAVMEIHLKNHLDFTNHDKQIILSAIQAVYGEIETIEFIIEKTASKVANSSSNKQTNQSKETFESLKLPKDDWGIVLKQLIEKYGVNIYKNWFSKLTANIDITTRTIELKATNAMVEYWVSSNYKDILTQIMNNMGLKLSGIR